MGTSMAFYHIKNRGFDRQELQRIMSQSVSPSTARDTQFKEMFGEELLQLYHRFLPKEREELKPVLGYRPDAPWLPFFDTGMCDGYNASSHDAKQLSTIFGAPVIAFSIFDSDILMLSYSDAERGINYDYAKPNCEEMEEYDTSLFRAELPLFLLFLCPELTKEKLTEIWEGEEVFADDRMEKLCEALDMHPIYQDVPEGFEAIQADQT